ncbi:serine/threonine protein phosphatase [Clostridia bacterium]|nr:serine/threonine protein phosphatase [Clostridia bacterium]
MRIALIADLHGNLPATLAVAEDIKKRGADTIYCLGDLIGKGPDSPETMDWAFANCEIILGGNWDLLIAQATEPSDAVQWYRNQLGSARLRKLAALLLEHWFTFSGRKVRLVHGRPVVPKTVHHDSPREEHEWFFDVPGKPDVVGFADIHEPFYLMSDGRTLFNTGSVGNPIVLSQTAATYMMLDGELGGDAADISYTIHMVEYDREQAVSRTLARPGLPMGDAFINEIRTGKYSR